MIDDADGFTNEVNNGNFWDNIRKVLFFINNINFFIKNKTILWFI